ncbi:hypothetical protein CRE_17526 [Caenorhabditis remanei]|uniref:Uncharacterized protein n=1 Tax=Caenorhabditis remanei TaxID=31234 RepID=E3NC28_CAERE|nr:hypothetical protein CRE_17526 [Caenorhabditis remanei]
MYNGFGYRDSPPRYFEGFQSQNVRNDARMSNRPNNHHSPPRNQDRFRSPDHYRSNSPSGGFGGQDAYNDQRQFENRNQGHYSPNPPNWQYDERGRSNSPRGQQTLNFRQSSWSPIPGERRCRSPSAQNGYSVRNRSPSPYGQVYSNYHQDNWQPRPEQFRNRSTSQGPRDDWSPIPGERRCRSPSRQYEDHSQGNSRNSWSPQQNWNNQQRNRSLSPEGPSTSRQYDDRNRAPSYQYSSYSREVQGTSNYHQNRWSPSPTPHQENQNRNRSGILQEPGLSNNRDNSWSSDRTRNVKPSLPVSGFQQPVPPLQYERRVESPYPNERQEEKPKDRIVKKEPEEEEEEVEEEPIDEEERNELFAALIREEPKRRIERSNGKWKLSITETCCDPSFLWDKSAELHLYQNIC